MFTSKWSKDQKYIASGFEDRGTIKIYNADSYSLNYTFDSGLSFVYELDFSWDNKKLLVCGANSAIIFSVGGTWP